MGSPRRVLVVTPDADKASAFRRWLNEAGYRVGRAATFSAAKTHLEELPDLVITDVRLGAYNGLHLALHAGSRGIPTLVMGTDDPVLFRDATALHAHWLGASTDPATLLLSVRALIGDGELDGVAALGAELPSVSWWSIVPEHGGSHLTDGRLRKRLTQH